MVDPDVMDIEQRLRDLLTDDHLAVRVPASAVEAVHTGVRRRRRRARVAGTAGAVAAAVAVGAIAGPALTNRAPRPSPGRVAGATSGVWTPGPLTSLPTALTTPAAMAISDGIVWIAGPAARAVDGDVLARVDATSRRVTTMPAGVVSDLAATPQHLWVALRGTASDPRQCTLELRQTSDGGIVSTFPLPCDAGTTTVPSVTANGGHAWVVTDDGSHTYLRRYTAGRSTPPEQRILAGRLAGPHLLAIGGTSVYVVTLTAGEGAVLHQLSAANLRPLMTIAVPGARLIAYGSNRLYVADAEGVGSYPPDLSERSTFVAGHVTTLTTGAGIVWCDPGGRALAGLDPRTGAVTSVAEMPAAAPGMVRADGSVLWAVRVSGGTVGVQSAEPAP